MILKSICNTDFYELQMRESSYIYFDLFITFCYLKQVSRIYILKEKKSVSWVTNRPLSLLTM